jgi:hypothetical protein
MTGRTCLKHGVPEWCPEGVCRWCEEPEKEAAFTFMGIPVAVIPAIAPTTVRSTLGTIIIPCPHNKGWYDSNATYTYSCNACGKVWPMATGPRYAALKTVSHYSACPLRGPMDADPAKDLAAGCTCVPFP